MEKTALFSVGIITVSDKGARGDREDKSGPAIKEIVTSLPAEVKDYEIVPDSKEIIANKIKEFADNRGLDLIITTGGTGVSPRDVTPEATLEVIEKEIPGMAEVMRMEGLKKTPHAMISRAVVGMRHQSLIINLPGSPKAVRENLLAILPALPHALSKIKGDETECART
ncbi:MAG: MogA/MoaB family molybdenum cofactor biosynthesis protein [Deltaproteobacteria bacterium]|nr:MogA/MoaB family molybdenum cofactor biosynthesis protein [Deltaproteobacteria bacterium]